MRYIGNLISNKENINKLEKNNYIGQFNDGTQEFTYVYEINAGTGNIEEYPQPPQTGYNFDIKFNINIIYVLLTYIILSIKKFILFN